VCWGATDAADQGLALHIASFTAIDLTAVRPPRVDRAWLAAAGRIIPPLLAELAAARPDSLGADRKSEERAFHSAAGVS
jgi:hypothetical protein